MKTESRFYSKKPNFISVSNYSLLNKIVTSATTIEPLRLSYTIGVWHVKHKIK